MKRYTEVRNYDDTGEMLDGTRESPTGEYIMVDDLLAWLDAEIALTKENALDTTAQLPRKPELMGAVGTIERTARFTGMLDAYRAVKAHITGE